MSPGSIVDTISRAPNPSSRRPVQSSQCDVLVVGAGPSGLMIAQALARLGIRVRIIERRIPGSQYGNADGLQPRTLEIWKSYGMLGKIRAKGACMRAMVAYETASDGRGIIRLRPVNNVVVPCRYQYEITASITDIEGTLRERAEEAGVRITQPCWPTSLEVGQQVELAPSVKTYPIKVTLEHPARRNCKCHVGKASDVAQTNRKITNGNNKVCSCDQDAKETPAQVEIVNANYVIGADGASSWVRRSLGIDMEGEQTGMATFELTSDKCSSIMLNTEDVWGVVDVLVDTDLPDYRFKCVIQAVSGAIIIIPRECDKIRIYVQLSADDSIPRNVDGKLNRSSLQEEKIREKILSRIKIGFSPYRIEFMHVFWYTVFSTAQKVATTFSYKNRVFIAGDACHTHSPKAGQGANASMGDSHNLAWKLAYVLRGWADPSLLQTYEAERRAYALDLIYFDREISQSLEGGPAAEYQRLLHKQNMFTSGMGISYASSSLTIQPATSIGRIIPGECLLPSPIIRLGDWFDLNIHDLLISDGLFKILVLPGNISLPQSKFRLNTFAKALSESIQGQNADLCLSRLAIYTIVRNNKEDVVWTDVPASIARSWRRQDKEDIYEKFGISALTPQSDGVFILIRPDGYVSMVSTMTPDDGRRAVKFVYSL